MRYRQLTQDQRYHIYGLWCAGPSQSDIAKEIGVHKSTIGREIKRNSRWNGYYPEQAQFFSEQRRRYAKKHIRLTNNAKDYIREKLLLDWSPEQISGYAKRHKICLISHERIYQFIAEVKKIGGNLYLHLRHQCKRYRKRYGSPARSSPIKNRIFIEDRPEIVNTKSRLGDWEIILL